MNPPKPPAVHPHAVFINVGQRLQIFHAFHLVLHFHLSELSEGGLFKLAPSIFRAAVVEYEYDVAFLRHVGFPRAGA